MPSSQAQGTTSPTVQTGSKSLLSRIKSPFGSKVRNFTDFHIEPDDPHRQYTPGDVITGSVVLKAIKPVRVTHLVVSLHGYAQVFKNPNNPGDGFRTYNPALGTGKGNKDGGYFGNGFASLFEDETVLCGEGRLAEGIYQFRFELEFPSKGLPSSIDFERGTISYMLTATLTRPNTIGPTISCDRKVYLLESIDIALFHEPKPRVISLEPISRKSRTRPSAKARRNTGDVAQVSGPATESGDSPRLTRSAELSSIADDEAPGSPAPSDISFDSQASNLTSSGADSGEKMGSSACLSGGASSTLPSGQKRTITATIELSKSAFLRGDNIPLKISVVHTKRIQRPRGIIVTLYRQARVDMHPALPVTTPGKSDKVKADDYYPKSKTGLGGLSLSSAGSSHLFRKDLSQSFAALVIDPVTLTAEVKAGVRVPEEAFPTISTVPGAMISFKYYVEVVVDIQGKISGLDKYFPNPNVLSVHTGYGNSQAPGGPAEETGSIFSAWGANFIDTAEIRRDKSVVSCVFEVVVGTKDSERRKGKRRVTVSQGTDNTVVDHNLVHQPSFDSHQAVAHHLGPLHTATPEAHLPPHLQNIEHRDHAYPPPPPHVSHPAAAAAITTGAVVPAYDELSPTQRVIGLPSLPEESSLSEKERLRLAETRLLPSRPPEDTHQGSPSEPIGHTAATAANHAPSAPILLHHSSFSHIDSSVIAGPSAPPPDAFAPYLSPVDLVQQSPSSPSSPSAAVPDYHSIPHIDSSATVRLLATDDKHELHRHRLEMERSAPNDFPEIEDEQERTDLTMRAPSSPSLPHRPLQHPSAPPLISDPEDTAPSAPPVQDVVPLDEVDDHHRTFGLGTSATSSMGAASTQRGELPRYER